MFSLFFVTCISAEVVPGEVIPAQYVCGAFEHGDISLTFHGKEFIVGQRGVEDGIEWEQDTVWGTVDVVSSSLMIDCKDITYTIGEEHGEWVEISLIAVASVADMEEIIREKNVTLTGMKGLTKSLEKGGSNCIIPFVGVHEILYNINSREFHMQAP